jgi:ADP-ribose pyrophosphatase
MDTARFPDGSSGELELVRHSGAAAVVAVLGEPRPEDPDIVLLRQFRYAAGGELYEIPAGRPDRTASPGTDVARRELEEETGYTAGRAPPPHHHLHHPRLHRRAHPPLPGHRPHPGATNLDEDEFVEVIILPLSHALEAIRTGRIIDSKSICALLYYASFAR